MSQEVGEIELGLSINQSLFNKQLLGLAKSANRPVVNAFKPIGKAIGSALAVGSVVAFTKSCLDLGSDLSEVQNVVDTTFKTMSESVDDFATKAMKQFGLSETVSKQYMGTLGAMSKSMGFTENASYDMAKAVTSLTGDVASFYNLSTDEAFNKLKSIWTGETETLKSIGVLLTQTNLDQYALNNGFGKTTAKMTEQEKVMLRYQYTMSALSDASGDFAKTSGSWANQTRILTLQFNSLKATLGQGFINLFTPIIQVVNELLGDLQLLAQEFKSFTEIFSGDRGSSAGLVGIANTAGDVATELGNVETAAKKANKAVNLLDIDELTVINPSGGSNGSASNTGNIGMNSTNTVVNQTSTALNTTSAGMDKFLVSVDPFTTAIKNLWNGGLSDLGKFSAKGLLDFYEEFLVPLGKWAFSTEDKGFTRLVDIINEDLSDVDWNTINKNLKDFWVAVEPYAESFGEGLIDFFEDTSDISVDILEKLFGNEGVMTDVTSWLNDNNPEDARLWGHALGDVAVALLAFKTVGNVLPTLMSLFGLLKTFSAGAIGTGIAGTLASLGGIGGMLTTDLAVVLGAGTAAEIGLTFATGFVGAFIAAVGGWNLGQWLYEEINGEEIDMTWTEQFEAIKESFSDGSWKSALELWGNDISEGIKTAGTTIQEFIMGIDQWYNDIENDYIAWCDEIDQKYYDWCEGIDNDIDAWLEGICTSAGNWWKEDVLGGLKNWKDDISSWWRDDIKPLFDKDVWKAGMGGVNEAFKEVFKGAANVAIEKMNQLISGLNEKMSFSWEAVSIFGKEVVPAGSMQLFQIPLIPALANGGYVGANQPQLAMIGDNRREGEIVAPESKLLNMAVAAAEMAGGSASTELLMKIIELLELILDKDTGITDDDISRSVRRINDEHIRRTGNGLFEY